MAYEVKREADGTYAVYEKFGKRCDMAKGTRAKPSTEETIKRSVVESLKQKYGMENEPDDSFLEWWRRNHGTGYALRIVEEIIM